MLGTAHEERVLAIAEQCWPGHEKVWRFSTDIVNQGQQAWRLARAMIDYWRDMMIVNSCRLAGQTVAFSARAVNILEKNAKQGNLDTILAGMESWSPRKSAGCAMQPCECLAQMALVRFMQLADMRPDRAKSPQCWRRGCERSACPRAAAPEASAGASATTFEKKKA